MKENLKIMVGCNTLSTINTLAYINKKRGLEKIYDLLIDGGMLISLHNSTYSYTLKKPFIEKKSKKRFGRVGEFLHSTLVALNMISYTLFSLRILRTTWSSARESLEVNHRGRESGA